MRPSSTRLAASQMPNPFSSLRLTIYSLLLLSFFLGLPQFHYLTALMIMLIIRRKNVPGGLLAPVVIPLPQWKQPRFDHWFN